MSLSCKNSKNELKEGDCHELISQIIEESAIVRVSECPTALKVDYSYYETIRENFSKADFESQSCKTKKFNLSELSNSLNQKIEPISSDSLDYFNKNINELREHNSFYSMSYPVLNFNNSKAMVHFEYHCGRYCSFRELRYYIKEQDKWHLELTLSKTNW